MLFSTDLTLPRDERSTSIPTSWARDPALSHEERGALAMLASMLTPGEVITHYDVDELVHHEDMSVSWLVLGLHAAGYLRRSYVGTVERYDLVHPDRLPPLPPFPAP